MTESSFNLKEHARDFVTREIGRSLRAKLFEFEDSSPRDIRLTIDTSGVSIMTPSFVDEFFGRTAATLGLDQFRARFNIVGVDENTKTLINRVVRNRLLLDKAPERSPRVS